MISKAGQRSPMRMAVLAATAGCALEFYDFITFAFFAIQIGHSFFPSTDRYVSLMGSLATFGAGFLTRPVGAHVLGGYADRIGRKPVMLLSMVIMGVAIATLALTPSYAQIGLAAPVIAVAARLAQGFALGGEIGCSTVYMMEAGHADRRGYNVSLQGVAQYVAATFGALVGFSLSSAMSEAQLSTIGWRIALLIGVSVVPFALVVRKSLPETKDGADPQVAEGAAPGPTAQQAIVLGAVIMGSATFATYVFNYTATFGQSELHLSTRAAMAGELAANGVGIVASLAGGWLCDRYGRRPLQLWPQLAFTVLILPCFSWLTAERTVFALISVNLLLSGLSNLQTGALYAAITESLPRAKRGRTFALVYALPVTVLGGTTQLFVTWLLKTTGTPMSLAWYLAGVQLVGLAAIVALPESAPKKRRLAELKPVRA
jgi:MHS family citrate/tricarballylate:H+ symporter-like MFS transporter